MVSNESPPLKKLGLLIIFPAGCTHKSGISQIPHKSRFILAQSAGSAPPPLFIKSSNTTPSKYLYVRELSILLGKPCRETTIPHPGIKSMQMTIRVANNTATVNNNRCSNKQLLAKFAGHKTVIRADIWCNLYEVVTNGQTDQQRLFGLMAYLIDDALNWFGTDIAPKLAEYSWSTVREMLIARFGPAIANPLVEAQRRHLKPTETVQNYYDDKMRCLRHVSLKEEDMVAQLTEGMPISYKGLLLCSKPPTTVSWLAIALQLEATVKRQPFTVTKPKPPYQNKQQFRPVSMIASTASESQNNPRRDYRRNQNSNPPSTPCRYCQEAGETVYHWHNQCPPQAEDKQPNIC